MGGAPPGAMRTGAAKQPGARGVISGGGGIGGGAMGPRGAARLDCGAGSARPPGGWIMRGERVGVEAATTSAAGGGGSGAGGVSVVVGGDVVVAGGGGVGAGGAT